MASFAASNLSFPPPTDLMLRVGEHLSQLTLYKLEPPYTLLLLYHEDVCLACGVEYETENECLGVKGC